MLLTNQCFRSARHILPVLEALWLGRAGGRVSGWHNAVDPGSRQCRIPPKHQLCASPDPARPCASYGPGVAPSRQAPRLRVARRPNHADLECGQRAVCPRAAGWRGRGQPPALVSAWLKIVGRNSRQNVQGLGHAQLAGRTMDGAGH